MDLSAYSSSALYLVIGLVVLWRLPVWGQRVLAFLRDLKRFRQGE